MKKIKSGLLVLLALFLSGTMGAQTIEEGKIEQEHNEK